MMTPWRLTRCGWSGTARPSGVATADTRRPPTWRSRRTASGSAAALRDRLDGKPFALVLTSPRERARQTARLTGHPEAEVDADLAEWDYGDLEGETSEEIRESYPGWTIWSGPVPGGETSEQVGARLDRVVERCRAADGRVAAVRPRACAAGAGSALAGPPGRRGPAPAARHRDRVGARFRARDAGRAPVELLTGASQSLDPGGRAPRPWIPCRYGRSVRAARSRWPGRPVAGGPARTTARSTCCGGPTRRRTTSSCAPWAWPATSRRTSRGR